MTAVDAEQVRQLLAEKQRLTDLVDELRKTANTRGDVIDRQTRELKELGKRVAHLEAARDAAQRDAVTWESEYERVRDERLAELASALEERNAARAELADARRDRDAVAAELADAERDRDAAHAALEEQAAANVEPHRHTYEWPSPHEEPLDCACGQPYPRADIPGPAKDVPPDVEPWPTTEIFARVRAELKGRWPA